MKLVNMNKRHLIIEVTPEELAAQLTLIDLPIFKSISRDELLNLGKSSSKKQNSVPNVVTMNKQFNQVTFWVVGQILIHQSPRARAELISHFIKTAKRLYLLNNLHSSYALISALLSSPIYRLDRTWHVVKKKFPKDRQQFEQLRELYLDNNNYQLLRNHLASCSLPCIPYLGVYSRDIIYIKEAHQEGTIQRSRSISKILKSIERFQSSEYNCLSGNPELKVCLLSNRYIDELQRFVEDENYRRSIELEPPDSALSGDSSDLNGNVTRHHHRKSAMLLASLTSMVQSAVMTTSNKLAIGMSQTRSTGDLYKLQQRYLIDDSFMTAGAGHTSFPPPISTSN